jgi:hypothetical protein
MLKTKVTLDPCAEFTTTSDNDIAETCGILPYWIINETNEKLTMLEIFNEQYSFGVHEMTGGTINTETGVYSYPEDPDLIPLIKLEKQGETMYQYHYGIVAIVNDTTDETFVTRLD